MWEVEVDPLMVPSGLGPLGRSGLFLISGVSALWLTLRLLQARSSLKKGATLVEAFGGRVRLGEFTAVGLVTTTMLLVAILGGGS